MEMAPFDFAPLTLRYAQDERSEKEPAGSLTYLRNATPGSEGRRAPRGRGRGGRRGQRLVYPRPQFASFLQARRQLQGALYRGKRLGEAPEVVQGQAEMDVSLRHERSGFDEPPVQRQGIPVPRLGEPKGRQPLQGLGVERVDIERASIVPGSGLGLSLLFEDLAQKPVRPAGDRAAWGEGQRLVEGRNRGLVFLHPQEHGAERDPVDGATRLVLDRDLASFPRLREPDAHSPRPCLASPAGACLYAARVCLYGKSRPALPLELQVDPREQDRNGAGAEREGLIQARRRGIETLELVQSLPQQSVQDGHVVEVAHHGKRSAERLHRSLVAAGLEESEALVEVRQVVARLFRKDRPVERQAFLVARLPYQRSGKVKLRHRPPAAAPKRNGSTKRRLRLDGAILGQQSATQSQV